MSNSSHTQKSSRVQFEKKEGQQQLPYNYGNNYGGNNYSNNIHIIRYRCCNLESKLRVLTEESKVLSDYIYLSRS